MNTFEAGVISAIPVGGIVGGILCKSYGLLAIIGGAVVGGIAGGFTGWAYAMLIAFVTSAFMAIWRGIRKLPDLGDGEKEEVIVSMMHVSMHVSNKGAILGAISGCVAGFLFSWWHGLLVAFVIAIITAFVAVIKAQLGIRKIQQNGGV